MQVNVSFPEVKEWVKERMGADQKIGKAEGKLRQFIIEPFLPHTQSEELHLHLQHQG